MHDRDFVSDHGNQKYRWNFTQRNALMLCRKGKEILGRLLPLFVENFFGPVK
jgi:hypothetical protein